MFFFKSIWLLWRTPWGAGHCQYRLAHCAHGWAHKVLSSLWFCSFQARADMPAEPFKAGPIPPMHRLERQPPTRADTVVLELRAQAKASWIHSLRDSSSPGGPVLGCGIGTWFWKLSPRIALHVPSPDSLSLLYGWYIPAPVWPLLSVKEPTYVTRIFGRSVIPRGEESDPGNFL